MADLDTRSKRASSLRLLLPFVLVLPLADGTISQADRQHVVCDYSGILAAGAVTPNTVLDTEYLTGTFVPSELVTGTYDFSRAFVGTSVIGEGITATRESARNMVGTYAPSAAFVGTVGL